MSKNAPTVSRRTVVAAGALAAAAPGALAQQPAWPARPVRIIIPFAASGGADTFTRLMTEPLAAAFGQPFVVENRPGGGGVIGTDAAAKAAPDGHTVLMTLPLSHVNNAINLVAAGASAEALGLKILQPGESLTAQMTIEVEKIK